MQDLNIRTRFQYLFIILTSFLFVVVPQVFSAGPQLVINRVAFDANPDWVEIYVFGGDTEIEVGLYEGASNLLKEIGGLPLESGQRIVIHFDGDEDRDETALTGPGEDGIWDLFVGDSGLTATDNILRLQMIQEPVEILSETVWDAVIWSNGNGKFTGNKDTAGSLVQVGQWVGDFSIDDSSAWTDSDSVHRDQVLARRSLENDTNSPLDWEVQDIVDLAVVSITPVLTSIPTLSPTPSPEVIQSEPLLVVNVPEMVESGAGFDFQIEYSDLPLGEYWLKFEASADGSKWYAGKTYGNEPDPLPWNASWENFPRFIVDQASGKVAGKAELDAESAGTYSTRAKVKLIESGVGYYTDIKYVAAVLPTPTPLPTSTPATEQIEDSSSTQIDIDEILIADARQLEPGSEVRIEGTVISAPENLGVRVMYVEDESGGIKILLDEKDRTDIHYQDYVEVVGRMGESFNETYLRIDNANGIRVISTNQPVEPQVIETGDLSEDQEGQLVTVNGQISSTSGNTFYVDDGSGEAKIYIKDSTGIDKPKMKSGEYCRVTGIDSQYKDEYRILPRFVEDILVSKNPISEDKVLGAQSLESVLDLGDQLPVTGYNGSDLGLILLWVGVVLRRLTQ